MPFTFQRLDIPEVVLIKPQVFHDDRGFLMETYKAPDFAAFGIRDSFVQENHSCSFKNVIRGLHYQNPPFEQAKLIRVIRGRIFDVAVDIRKGSPTWGKWVAVILSEESRESLYIPPGFAHGFCVLSEAAEVIYKTTNVYSPECEGGIAWNSPEIKIDWPIRAPILSRRDASLPSLAQADVRFYYGKGV